MFPPWFSLIPLSVVARDSEARDESSPMRLSVAGCGYVTYVWLIAQINRYFKSQPFLIS